MIIGHKHAQTFFAKAMERGVLSHAYALIGSEHVGKETIATWVASELLKVRPEKVARHPDVRLIRREFDTKNNRFKRDISVEEMRDVVRFASESPFQPNGYKVVIVNEAGRLNAIASNAILKMLEEPPERTIFFLLYQNEGEILPTIRSRAQVLTLSRVSDEELQAGLGELGFKDTDEVVQYALGLPGQAINWLHNPDAFAALKNNSATLANVLGAPITQKFQVVEPWFAEAKDEGGVDQVVARLEEWRQVLFTWLHVGDAPIQPKQIVETIDRLEETITALRKNAHPPLMVQSFLLCLP